MMLVGCREVDIIYAHTGPPNYFEPGGRIENCPGDLGAATHDQGIVFTHSLEQVNRRDPGTVVHYGRRAQNGLAVHLQTIGYQNFHFRHARLQKEKVDNACYR
ncbi:MAG TPA: hypothetical protein VF498_13770 [Anaerolineales bacterium]